MWGLHRDSGPCCVNIETSKDFLSGTTSSTASDSVVNNEPNQNHEVTNPVNNAPTGQVTGPMEPYQQSVGGEYKAAMELELQLVLAKIELARLELELRQVAAQNRVLSPRYLKAETFLIPVGVFDGETRRVESWIDVLSTTVTAYGGDDEDKFRVANGLITGLARAHVNKQLCSNWTELSSSLVSRFKDQRSLLDVYEELTTRTKKQEESLHAYAITMDEIADSRVPGEDLVPIIISGMRDASKFTSMLAGATSIQELQRLIPAFDRNKKLEPI